MKSEMTTLATLAGGAALERFADELSNVLSNIADPNTEAEALREVTLTVKIKPTEDRSMGDVQVVTKSKLAPFKAVSTLLYFGASKDGKRVAVEHNPKQVGMFDEPEAAEVKAFPRLAEEA